jgi:inner membrane protein
MSEFISLNGPWLWFIIAGLLLIGELLSPGVFMMWLAGAAVITGFADLAFSLGWAGEIITFGLTALLTVFASWKHVTSRWSPVSDQPHLNQRHHAYVGRTVALDQAIINGHGKVRLEDALWDVDGEDAPAGTMVKLTGVNGLRLVATRIT